MTATIDGEPWPNLSACRGDDPAAWSPPLTIHHVLTCGACPVRAQCADDAIAHRDRYTIRVAADCSTAAGRRQLRAAAQNARLTAELSNKDNRVTVNYG